MPSESSQRHKSAAAEQGPVSFGVVTVSDSRTPETDTNYAFLRDAIEAAGHTLSAFQLVRDEADQVSGVLDDMIASGAQIVLFNGGTGISTRDRTFDALSRKLEKTLPGFGELFRMLSYEQVGSAAMLSRAVAGTYRGAVIFSTPGSPAAVSLAWHKLILPEIQHLAWELARATLEVLIE